VQVFINSINNQNGLTKNPIHLLSIELKIAVFLLSFRKQLKNHTVKNTFLFNNRYFILVITILICSACDSSNPVKEKAPANENEELRRKELELKERELNIREKELSQKEEEIAPKSKAKESPYKSYSPSKEDKQSCLNLLNRWSYMLAEHNINEAEYVYDTKVHYYTQLLSREKVFDNLSTFFENDPSFYQYVYNEVITPLSHGTFKCEFDKHTSMNGKNKVYPSYLIMKYNSMGELKIIHESDYVTDENIAKKTRSK